MISEDDRGRALADLVVAEIVRRFPRVTVEQPEPSPDAGCSLVYLTPPNAQGAPVLLYANFDWSFQLEVDDLVLFEDLPMEESESERVERIVNEITTIAVGGLPPEQGWLRRILSSPRRSDAWA